MEGKEDSFAEHLVSMKKYVTTIREGSLDDNVIFRSNELLATLDKLCAMDHSGVDKKIIEKCYSSIFDLMEEPEVMNKYL